MCYVAYLSAWVLRKRYYIKPVMPFVATFYVLHGAVGGNCRIHGSTLRAVILCHCTNISGYFNRA
jgi:uncharacterized membrane protein (GlpM family)